MADMRFEYIGKVCDECVIKPHESKEHIRSQKIDEVLTGKYTAIPVFVGIMALVFYLTFFLIGPFFQGLLESGIGALAAERRVEFIVRSVAHTDNLAGELSDLCQEVYCILRTCDRMSTHNVLLKIKPDPYIVHAVLIHGNSPPGSPHF